MDLRHQQDRRILAVQTSYFVIDGILILGLFSAGRTVYKLAKKLDFRR